MVQRRNLLLCTRYPPDGIPSLHLCVQEGAPFSASLDRLEQRISDQIDGVVDVVLTGKLTALQHGCIENFIIAEVRRTRGALGDGSTEL